MGKNIVTRRLSVETNVMKLTGENPQRVGLLVYNNGSATVYILGAKSNSKEEGIPISPGATYEDDKSTGVLYIVADSGIQDVRVLTIGG